MKASEKLPKQIDALEGRRAKLEAQAGAALPEDADDKAIDRWLETKPAAAAGITAIDNELIPLREKRVAALDREYDAGAERLLEAEACDAIRDEKKIQEQLDLIEKAAAALAGIVQNYDGINIKELACWCKFTRQRLPALEMKRRWALKAARPKQCRPPAIQSPG